jgi:hypothetical protein
MPVVRPPAWNPDERRGIAIDKPKKAKKLTAWLKIAVVIG